MPLLTTTIGAYPEPDYLPVPDWFRADMGPSTTSPTAGYLEAVEAMGAEAEVLFSRAVKEAVEDQVDCGIDLPTDGEIRRENYIHYHCRHLAGFDFEHLKPVLTRGHLPADLPTITAPVTARDIGFLAADWRLAQSFTSQPVKITMPGPMTIADTTANEYYGDPRQQGDDLADALNAEVLALAEAGCRWIQIDEPVFARKPEQALDYGIEDLERCFHGLPKGVNRVMHMCCGYPGKLDEADFPKADRGTYFKLAEAVDATSLDAVSIEDAYEHNDLRLLELFRRTKVIFGAVGIATSRHEPVEEIRARLQEALEHIEAERLIAAPDCGLGLLGRELSLVKLKNLSAAAKSL